MPFFLNNVLLRSHPVLFIFLERSLLSLLLITDLRGYKAALYTHFDIIAISVHNSSNCALSITSLASGRPHQA